MPVEFVREIDIFIYETEHIHIIKQKWKNCNRIAKKLQLKYLKKSFTI